MKMKNFLFLIIAAFCFFVVGCGDKERDNAGEYDFAHIEPDTNWFKFAGAEYTISTMEELVGLSVLVANGRNMRNKTIKLGADISLTVKNKKYQWQPIGSRQIDGHRPFCGTFDGNGHIISGVYVNTTLDDKGLFGWIEDAVIKNLGVTDLHVKGQNRVGGLVGTNRNSQIRNCYTTGKVEGGGDYVGGLVGHNDGGKIYDSYSKCSVSGNDYVGGFAGISPGYPTAISRCYSIGSVSGKTEKVGGFVGGKDINSPIINCYYNKETSNQQDTEKGEPKTTADMKKQATYLEWDFSAVWGLKSSINDGYPYLNTDTDEKPVVVPQRYTITFNSSGGIACSPISAESGTVIKLPSTTREGYTFDGWFSAASGGTLYGNAGGNHAVTRNLTMYAQWTQNCEKPSAPTDVSVTIENFPTYADDEQEIEPILPEYFVYINWSAVSGASSYEIYRRALSIGIGGEYSLIGTSDAPYYNDVHISSYVRYNYSIKAINACGESEMSEPAYIELGFIERE